MLKKLLVGLAVITASVEAQNFESCKVWFDGCNNCNVEEDNSLSGCTKRVCATRKKPFCRVLKTNLDTLFKKKMFVKEDKNPDSGVIEDWTVTSGIGPEKGLDF